VTPEMHKQQSLMRIGLHPPLGFRHMPALQPQTPAQALSSAIPARKSIGRKCCTRILSSSSSWSFQ